MGIPNSKLDGMQTLSKAFDVSTQAFSHLPVNSLVNVSYDAVSVTYPDAVTEVYAFHTGGIGGTLVCTVTLVYTDSTKASLSSAVRT